MCLARCFAEARPRQPAGVQDPLSVSTSIACFGVMLRPIVILLEREFYEPVALRCDRGATPEGLPHLT